ncbi:MAG: hypothetical protein ABIO82_03615 [Ginsengibacter sp.]
MNETQPVGMYWIAFIISTIALILVLFFLRQYFWMILPFFFTSFGKAMRII